MFPSATNLPSGESASTSLVTTIETVDEKQSRCYRTEPRMFVACNDSTKWFLSGCGAYVCDFCGPKKAQQFAKAVSWAMTQQKRTRFCTLTLAPEDWQTRRQKMRDLARSLRAEGYDTEWTWTTETGKSTGMIHVHSIQYGDYIPQRLLEKKWGARVDIRAIKMTEKSIAGYITKEAGKVSWYITKDAATNYQAWRNLNGGRPHHSSRGFFMGHGVSGALRAYKLTRSAGEVVQWRPATATETRNNILGK